MITRDRIPKPIWRLFYQRFTPGWQGTQAIDAGFTGEAGNVVIDDEWQLARRQAAQDSYGRMTAAMGYMMKQVKNAQLAASEGGDQHMTDNLQEACQKLANSILVAANGVRQLAGARGYDPAY